MRTIINRFLGITVTCLIIFGCDSTLNTGSSDTESPNSPTIGNFYTELQPVETLAPTAANDGLEQIDISGISATDFVTAGTGTASRQAEPISVEVPAGATVQAVYLYWARLGNDIDNDPRAPSTILVNGSKVTGVVAGNGPVDNPDQFLPSQFKAGITHRANLTGAGLISPGLNTFTVQDDPATPDFPAQPLGASVIVFYSEANQDAELLLFDGTDYLWANAGGNTFEQRLALAHARPVMFTFNAAAEDRIANLSLFIGDVEPEDASERPNSLNITIGNEPTQVIGPNPPHSRGSRDRSGIITNKR